jgi:glutathione S-transferase
MVGESEPGTLLNFAPMIDSEFCRFVLDHYGVAYVERRHIFPIVSLLSFFRSGSPLVPLYTGGGVQLAGPRSIAEHYEKTCSTDRTLFPTNATDMAQLETDFAHFNTDLGHLTAVIAYYYLLPHKDIMLEPFTRGGPAFEAGLLQVGYPLVTALFTSILKLSPDSAAQAYKQVQAIFSAVDGRIADGRAYLIGGKLSLADLALATAAAPILLPEFFGSPMPKFESMPPDLKTIMTELRQHPTARFIETIYQKHRRGG